MVNQKYVAISYFCMFLFIYICAITYSAIPVFAHNILNKEIVLPQSQAMNATMMGLSGITSLGSWSGIIISISIALIVLFYFSQFTMRSAYD